MSSNSGRTLLIVLILLSAVLLAAGNPTGTGAVPDWRPVGPRT